MTELYVCIKERGKEFAFCYIDCQHLRDSKNERGREKRRLGYENIHCFDCLKKYVHVLVVFSDACLHPQNVANGMLEQLDDDDSNKQQPYFVHAHTKRYICIHTKSKGVLCDQ
jgi:hypothetical protein